MTITIQTKAIPAKINGLIEVWDRFLAAILAYDEELNALATEETRLRGLDSGQDYLLVMSGRHAKVDGAKVAEDFARHFISAAEDLFSPAGAKLKVDLGDLKKNCPEYEFEVFEPVAVWKYLDQKYAGDNGAEKAYRDAAYTLGRQININPDESPKIVGGRTVVGVSTWRDKFDDTVSYQSRESLEKAIDSLIACGRWSQLWSEEEVAAAQHVRASVRNHGSKDASLERMGIGEHVLIVPFKAKWEFRLSPAFAEKVMIFMAQYQGFTQR